MAASPLINEEVLHAFVDGETDAQTNAIVLAYLSASPADAAQVETWRRQNELIRATFAKIEHEPIPLSLSLKPSRNFRGDSPVQLVPTAASSPPVQLEEPSGSAKTGDLIRLCVAIGIAFAVGMLAALITPHLTSPLAELVENPTQSVATAADGSLSTRTLGIAALHQNKNPAAIEIKAKDSASELSPKDFDLEPGLAHAMTGSDLSVTGFQISTAVDPVACLFLATKAGEPLTLCREPVSGTAGSPENLTFQVTEKGSLRAVDWREKNGRLALAGRLSEAALLSLCHRIHARMEAVGAKAD